MDSISSLYDGNHKKCSELQKRLQQYKEIEDICLKATAVLGNFDKLNIDTSILDTCNVFKYWMFDLLFNGFIVKKGYKDYSEDIFNEIFNFWNDFKGSDKCQFTFDSIFQLVFEKLKTLYEYSLDYANLSYNVYQSNEGCSVAYNNYIIKGVQIYEEIKHDCGSSNNKPYCELLKIIRQKNNNSDLLPLKSCKIKSAMPENREQERILSYVDGDPVTQAKDELTEHSTSGSVMAAISILLGILLISFIIYKV